MNEVSNIDDYKKHVVIVGERVHILPLELFEGVASKKINITEIEDLNDIVPHIIRSWLDVLAVSDY